MIISNNSPNLFKAILCVLNKDIEVDNSFLPIDKDLFYHTGKIEESDRGDYEICILKAGSKVWAKLMPNNIYHISDSENSLTTHAICNHNDLNLYKKKSFKP